MAVIPKAWLSPVKMERVIIHWTAGKHKASANDKDHYHILVEDDGKVVRGNPVISGNARVGAKGLKASHTLNCNTGSIGVSLCCMGNAVEQPFDAGKWPMTEKQWDKMILVVAELAEAYSIPIGQKTVLTHAEVQRNLGIKQRGKWDVTRLAFDLSLKGAAAVGDLLRGEVKGKKDATAEIVSLLSTRRKPAKLGGEADGEIDEPGASNIPDILSASEVSTVGDSIGGNVEGTQPQGDPASADLMSPPIEDKEVIKRQQEYLTKLNYHTGGVDGVVGPLTQSAIRDFRASHNMPPLPANKEYIDVPLITALQAATEPKQLAPERVNASAQLIREKVPEAKQTFRAKIVAAGTTVASGIGAAWNGIVSRWSDATEQISPLKEFMSGVPGWVWFLAGAGIAGSAWYFTRSAEESSGKAYRDSARL